MKTAIFSLLATVVWFGSLPIARGDPPLASCYAIQLATSQVEDCTAKGQFEPVVAAPLETASVNLQFDASLAGTQVVVQALDGGTLSVGGSPTIDQDGNLVFSYEVGEQPGLYRVSVVADLGNGSMPISLVQFQIPNPEQ